MAYYREGRIADALQDFEAGIELRPPGVKDSASGRCADRAHNLQLANSGALTNQPLALTSCSFVLGCLRAELGDPAAAVDFDFACALKPECRADCGSAVLTERVLIRADQRERERYGC